MKRFGGGARKQRSSRHASFASNTRPIPTPGRVMLGEGVQEGGRLRVEGLRGALGVLGRVFPNGVTIGRVFHFQFGWHSTLRGVS